MNDQAPMSNVWSPGFSRLGAWNRLKAGLQTWSLVIGHWTLVILTTSPLIHLVLARNQAAERTDPCRTWPPRRSGERQRRQTDGARCRRSGRDDAMPAVPR